MVHMDEHLHESLSSSQNTSNVNREAATARDDENNATRARMITSVLLLWRGGHSAIGRITLGAAGCPPVKNYTAGCPPYNSVRALVDAVKSAANRTTGPHRRTSADRMKRN
jgi:hypothetical protein